MARALIQCGIADLETTFAGAPQDVKMLRALKEELGFRQVPRAVALLAKVNLALKAFAAVVDSEAVEPVSETPMLQLDLSSTSGPGKFENCERMPEAVTASQPLSRESGPVKPKPAKEAFDLKPDAAYGLLQSSANSTWESVEEKRRAIVQRGSPENTSELGDAEREKLMFEAGRANAAYAVLLRERAKSI